MLHAAKVMPEVLFLTDTPQLREISIFLMLQEIVKKISDNTNQQSLSHKFRLERFERFMQMLNRLPKPVTILDIGGTEAFWRGMGFNEPGVTITLLNLEEAAPTKPPFITLKGNATNLEGMADKSYDIVFSNSVIEHLFTWENQQKMAAEVLRVGRYHYIQTPNYWFPVEPHWVFPFFQYFPQSVRCWLTQRFTLGHINRAKDAAAAKKLVEEIRLLTKKELQQLFPESAIYAEKIVFFTKSYTAYTAENQSK